MYESDIALKEESDAPETTVNIGLMLKTVCKPYRWHMATRYEIPCQVSGTFSFGHRNLKPEGFPGQRDHSWGVRD